MERRRSPLKRQDDRDRRRLGRVRGAPRRAARGAAGRQARSCMSRRRARRRRGGRPPATGLRCRRRSGSTRVTPTGLLMALGSRSWPTSPTALGTYSSGSRRGRLEREDARRLPVPRAARPTSPRGLLTGSQIAYWTYDVAKQGEEAIVTHPVVRLREYRNRQDATGPASYRHEDRFSPALVTGRNAPDLHGDPLGDLACGRRTHHRQRSRPHRSRGGAPGPPAADTVLVVLPTLTGIRARI